jgi:hypothetical protein
MFEDGKEGEAGVGVSIQPEAGVTRRQAGHQWMERAACARREKRAKYKARTIG